MIRSKRNQATAALLGVAAIACESADPPETVTFYDREIAPILERNCADSATRSGCHAAADNRGNAFGNLNLSSFEKLQKRRDLLLEYGPYGMPGLLAKAAEDFSISVTLWDSSEPIIVRTDIPHAATQQLSVTSAAFSQLQRWIERGATENNARPSETDPIKTRCRNALGDDPSFDPTSDPTLSDYSTFVSRVNPVLAENCAAGNCHGSTANSLYLSCGDTEEEKRWNYFAASDYIATTADSSELLRRALAESRGGVYHEGGEIFSTPDASGYRAILAWAEEKGGPTDAPDDTRFRFFAERVQPMLVKKGCLLIGCHSPAMGHDYRLHGGSGGHFGLGATRKNYELSLDQVALESPDPNASRLLRKNLIPLFENSGPRPQDPKGILHRGGALFGFGDDECDAEGAESGPLDEQQPYCVIRAWIEMERAERMADAAGFGSIVYVRRPIAAGRTAPQDFETFVAGADLVRAPASFDAGGNLSVDPGTSLLPLCGLDSASVDVRRPAVSWDGTRIAFAARLGEGQPWKIYVISGDQCEIEPTIDAAAIDGDGRAVPDNGELVHNFDPAFAPDGRIVFASTRGNVTNTAVFDYAGPQRAPADPSRLNANLYVAEEGEIRQLTFLLNEELFPSFMSDGRLIFVTEKRAPGFYQLAGRRQNLDGGDYHPLFGQRATIGFNQLTDVVELADKNLAAIFSDRGAAHGAGVLGIVNRSLGIDQRSDDPGDYLQDPQARDWQNPEFFQHSIRLLDGVGRPGEGGRVYRSPTPLPNGRILVSSAEGVGDVGSFSGGFDLYVVDPVTGARSGPVVAEALDLLWPVAVYARAYRGVYRSKLGEPNGATRISTRDEQRDRAEITFLDVPLLSSLLFQNTRSRRLVPQDADHFEVWESLPPEAGVKTFADAGPFVTSDEYGDLIVRRRRLGRVELAEDGSARVLVPGGMPLILAAPARLEGEERPRLHHQREEMQFYPGEIIRQGFRRDLFDGVCGSCHGSISGREEDVAINPDILTQASVVAAQDRRPSSLLGERGDIRGPDFD